LVEHLGHEVLRIKMYVQFYRKLSSSPSSRTTAFNTLPNHRFQNSKGMIDPKF